MSFQESKIAELESSQATLNYIHFFRKTSKVLSLLISVIGILVLIGYIMGIPFFVSVIPGSMPMRVNAATCFILSGAAMFLLQEDAKGEPPARSYRRIAYCFVLLIALFAIIPIYEFLLSVDIPIDNLILNAISANSFTRSMPLNVAFNFILISISLLAIDLETKRGYRLSQILILIECFIGMLGFVGYLYGLNESFGLAASMRMAFHSSVAFLMMTAAFFFARPTAGIMIPFISDSYDGVFVRITVPLTIIGAIIFGYIVLSGELAGFYGARFRLALTASAAMALVTFLIYVIARLFNEIEMNRRKMSSNQDFSSFVSHKLFTPLSVIIGSIELFKTGVYGQINEGMKNALQAIDESADKMRKMIKKLLALDELNMNDHNIPKNEIHLKEEIQKIADKVIAAYPAKKMEFSIVAGQTPLTYKMNRKHFTYIIENLLDNAIKFNDKDKAVISCAVLRKPAHLQIRFSDNGPGIPPEEARNIFRKFYQIEKTFTGNVEGMGLGLSIIKQLVESRGGSIHVESAIGKGSNFTVNLPLS
jgi:signal transduction histidine kinase